MGDWLDILPSWQSCNDLPELGRTVGTGVENGGGTVGGTFFWWVPEKKKVGGNDICLRWDVVGISSSHPLT